MARKVAIGGTIDLEAVVDVAHFCKEVDFEANAIKNLQRASEKLQAKEPYDFNKHVEKEFEPQAILPSVIVRAAVFCRLVQLSHGKSGIQFDVMEYLRTLLNLDLMPEVPIECDGKTPLYYIALVIAGKGNVIHKGTKMATATAVSQFTLSPPGLSVDDLHRFCNSTAFATAFAALSIKEGLGLLNVADGIAGLTCEALAAFTEPFDSKHHDLTRPHSGEMTVASNLRALLDGSRLVNSRKAQVHDPVSIHGIPQYSGPCHTTIQLVRKAVLIELNSAESFPYSTLPTGAGTVSAEPMVFHLKELALALHSLATGAEKRLHTLVHTSDAHDLPAGLAFPGDRSDASLFPGSYAPLVSVVYELLGSKLSKVMALTNLADGHCPSDAEVTVGLAVHTAVTDTIRLLATEAVAAMQGLNIREFQAAEKVARLEKMKEEMRLAREAVLKREGKEMNMKSKKEKKEKVKGLILGVGSTLVSKHLKEVGLGAAVCTTADLSAAIEKAVQALTPRNGAIEYLTRFLAASNQNKKPKLAKGTRDYHALQMAVREKAFKIIRNVFARHGAVTIDTPVFELKDTLMGKYGEDSKLIYELADQGGELLALRYDLTVPFARYLAMYNVGNIKRYHIGKVYRRDNPAMNKGRFREFYQCDFDIAGSYGLMIPDAETLKVMTEILDDLPIGNYCIKLNHRKLLDAMLDICGCPAAKFRPICSAIDKLDKEPWSKVKTEMVEEKGLPEAVADKIGKLVILKDEPRALMTKLKADAVFKGHKAGEQALQELNLLFDYFEAFGICGKISFDLSLARGLDYYTGVIFEAVLTDTNQVGSIAAGGRYDNLVGIFSNGKDIPAVGCSIGIERIFTIMEDRIKKQEVAAVRETETEVFVASVGGNLLSKRMALCSKLWSADIKAEYLYVDKPKMQRQLTHVLEAGIPIMIVIGEDEVAKGVVKVKDMSAKEEVEVPETALIEHVKTILKKYEC